ncbi:MAG: hypothetical protein ABIM30_01210 [candidate division WOR-3 bacterium]
MKKDKVVIDINKNDKLQLDNLIRLIGRMKIELEGAEVLMASDALRWVVKFQKQIEELDNRPDLEVKSLEQPIKKK